MTVPPDFVGGGLAVRHSETSAFGLRVDSSGRWATASGSEKVAQSIELILRTSPGDRPMRPRFGCPLRDFVFAPNNGSTHGLIAAEVEQAIRQWEPRVHKVDVVVLPDEVDHGRLLLDISYELRAENHRRNLVFPFYIIPEEHTP